MHLQIFKKHVIVVSKTLEHFQRTVGVEEILTSVPPVSFWTTVDDFLCDVGHDDHLSVIPGEFRTRLDKFPRHFGAGEKEVHVRHSCQEVFERERKVFRHGVEIPRQVGVAFHHFQCEVWVRADFFPRPWPVKVVKDKGWMQMFVAG